MQNEKPLILAVETSGRLGSVAVAKGEMLLAETQFTGPMRHSAEIFPAILGLLEQFNEKPDKIKQVYISVGPGSFTGLRIAVTIAKSMALANKTQIVAVNTLDVIAANVINLTAEQTQTAEEKINKKNSDLAGNGIQQLAVILDAKRNQFFAAVYEKNLNEVWNKTAADSLLTAEDFLKRFTDKPIAVTGEGLVFYKEKFLHKAVRILDEKYWYPCAANVHKLGWQKALAGEFADPVALSPNYIRGPDVIVKTL